MDDILSQPQTTVCSVPTIEISVLRTHTESTRGYPYVDRLLAIYQEGNRAEERGGHLTNKPFLSSPRNVVFLENTWRSYRQLDVFLPHCDRCMDVIHVPLGVGGPLLDRVRLQVNRKTLIVTVRVEEVARFFWDRIEVGEGEFADFEEMGIQGGKFIPPKGAGSAEGGALYYNVRDFGLSLAPSPTLTGGETQTTAAATSLNFTVPVVVPVGDSVGTRILLDQRTRFPHLFRPPYELFNYAQIQYQLKNFTSGSRRKVLHRVRIGLEVRIVLPTPETITLSRTEVCYFVKKDNQRTDRKNERIPHEFVFVPNSGPTAFLRFQGVVIGNVEEIEERDDQCVGRRYFRS